MEPIITSALIGAGIKGFSSLFGDSEEEKRNKQRQAAIKALRAQIARNLQQAGTEKLQSDRTFSGRVTDRRGALNSKLTSRGMDPIGSIYSNEEDLIEGNIGEKSAIDTRTAALNASVEDNIGELEAGVEEPEGGFSRFMGGAIEGANLGMGFGKALGFLDPKATGMGMGGTDGTPITTGMDNLGNDGNMGMGGDYGFLSPEKSMLSTGNLLGMGEGENYDYSGLLDKLGLSDKLLPEAGLKKRFRIR
jgi:hypothetical protein